MKFLCSVACSVALATSIWAQNPPPVVDSDKSKAAKPPAQKEADLEAAQRRVIALSLLTSLATEARSYRDETLRARVQARIADVLWDQDRESARRLFRRAWEAAEEVELQAAVKSGASSAGRTAGSRSPTHPRTNLREEILKLAARRDYALGEEFLAKLAAKSDEAGRVNDTSKNRPGMSEGEVSERLRLAGEFLEAGNTRRALQFADPALIEATSQPIFFLIRLRGKDATAADQRYATLLERAAGDPTSDANTVSLLTSYAFTPAVFLVVTRTGIPSINIYGSPPAPELAPTLRSSYFDVAANILMRPFTQLDQSSAGRSGTYFIATRLLPLFQQYAPNLTPGISAQLAALGPETAQATLNASDRLLDRGMAPEDKASDGIGDELKERLDRATGTDARDKAYAFAAMRAAEAGDPRASEFVDKIEDLGTRNGIRSFVNYTLIGGLLRNNNVDEALGLARKSELSHTLHAQVMTQIAGIIAKSDRVRALELLGEALSASRLIDAGSPERAYALVAVLAQLSKIDHVRAWELVGETVKAANAVADFTGENGNTSAKLEGKFKIAMSAELASATDLPESFILLSGNDFYQAISTGKSFSSDAARALVVLAIARSTLDLNGIVQPR